MRNRATNFANPVPGGTVGRTDQGVDISAPPGTPVDAIATEQAVGIIPNWYQGQPFEWFRILGTNTYDYVAEQVTRLVKPGTVVQRGQPIGYVAPSGTGLELGWADASGNTLAHDQGGYTEGQATAAGQSYRSQVIQGQGGGGNQSSLSQLWIEAGGDPRVANTMAAIAMAESGGDPNAHNPSGASGLWQILGQPFPGNVYDPLTNAKMAVAKYKTQGFGAWTTYTSGAYKQFLSTAASYVPNYGGPNGGIVRPGGQPSDSGASVQTALQNYVRLRDTPRTAPPDTKNPLQWWLASFTDSWSTMEGGSN